MMITSQSVRHEQLVTFGSRLAELFGSDGVQFFVSERNVIRRVLSRFSKTLVQNRDEFNSKSHSYLISDWHELRVEPSINFRNSVVFLVDALKRLSDPSRIFDTVCQIQDVANAVCITGELHDLSHLRDERILEELRNEKMSIRRVCDAIESYLISKGCRPSFVGTFADQSTHNERSRWIAILDQTKGMWTGAPSNFSVEAIIATYNDIDFVDNTIKHLLDQGCRISLIDDWSNDGSWEIINEKYGSNARIQIQRHETRSTDTYKWKSLLAQKERVANKSNSNWLIHYDSDELRYSPVRKSNLRESFFTVDQLGFNLVDHTVVNMRPIVDGYTQDCDLSHYFRHFQWGNRPSDFGQFKAWKNLGEPIDLVSSGGHVAQFGGQRVFPYKFLLFHYPIRSSSQARKKVVNERLNRFDSSERAAGWHSHYDQFSFFDLNWDISELIDFDVDDFYENFLIERISGVGIERLIV